jgi:type IV pilus assembly protein PilM
VLIRKRSPKTTVAGLELDPAHLAVAEVAVNGIVSVTRGAVAPLRPGVLRDGELADPQGLTEALQALFAEHDLPRRVRLGIANQRIVVRALDLPPLDDPKALAAAARQEAPDHIPMPMDEAIVDFQPVGIAQTPQGPRARVVVVAVRRELVDRIVGATREAGLTLEGIDLSAFAMVRAAGAPAEGAALYVNVAGLTNVAVANASGCLFTRAAAGGLDSMVHTLAERRALTVEHGRQWLGHVGLAAELEEVEGDPEIVAAARGVLEEGVHQLADSIRNSLNFYRKQESAETVERGLLTGPIVEIPGFTERLAEELHVPLEPVVVPVAGDAGQAASLTVAAGLAVEERA